MIATYRLVTACGRLGRSRDRRGVALAAAVVVLAITALLASAIAWQILATRRMLQHREHELQAQWLARAGVAFAAQRILQDPEFAESLAPDLLELSRVRVVVRRDADAPGLYHVTSESRYPTDTVKYVTRRSVAQIRRQPDGVKIRVSREL